MPDFFDRLLARHAPARGDAPTGVTRLRPRLPGPFERIGTTGFDGPEPSGARTAPAAGPTTRTAESGLRPAASRPAPPPAPTALGPAVAPAREHSPAAVTRLLPARPVLAVPAVPPLLASGPERDAGRSRRQDARLADPAERRPARRAARPTELPARTAGKAPAAAVPQARPRQPERAAAAAPAAERRRRHQAPERVVRVSIGRLEVNGERRPLPTKPAGRGAPDGGGRPRPALTLDQYLTRGNGGGA
ncbi:hypothetical protein M1P56_19515 [Streptomyces sp. HU2014]|uniref:hypothetical protein n=1 Tax=Streptomyces sp. HU2014 TaxID=2939414 RepID=UPI00200CB89C|nr:hypothetical protein [Streptomyces sp. HU2014]UQI46379.1 hypothetical protein M1P56_19515 [Streptomyces sp. HU2014]